MSKENHTMNRRFIPVVFALLVLPPAAALAADHQHADHKAKPVAAAADVIWADGTVKKIDRKGGMVTIAHGPLDSVGMSAMTMAFGVKDSAWLGQMKAGDRIRFVVDYVKGALVVVRYEPAAR